jgi:ABC-type bacteriocin/lantibiotic exporter with double-glycine peptidase domain
MAAGKARTIAKDAYLPHVIAKRRAACGANALYIFLRLHRVDSSYVEVMQALGHPPDECISGSNLLQLRDASRELGLRAVVRRCSLNELRRCTLPVIGSGRPSGMVTPESRLLRHYFVLLEVEGDTVRYIDPATGEMVHVDLSRFEWRAGRDVYVLTVDGSGNGFGWKMGCGAFLLLSLLWYYVAYRKRKVDASPADAVSGGAFAGQ